jgi:subtilisin family serine protease
MGSTAAITYRRQIQGRQDKLRAILATKKVTITGAADTILNAVFVTATADRGAELQGLPGVVGVVEMRHARRYTNKATQLVNAPAAWTATGGVSTAGAGMKIAILDTGIDQNHPAFQDSSLTVPQV